ncbi:hypothetical protein D584_25504 [Brucella intermedia M86]|uniref:Uncharacterized protein n=1 Tax=Brucella intermedia M86 TaxID=1234597 RepID=M5JJB3_9HYPH|nr:hypothetical protein D584_25504 [Brucella intermedia M86]
MHGDDFNVGKRQALKNSCQIFLVARNSVQGFDDNDVEFAGLGVVNEVHYALTSDKRRARLSAVVISLNYAKPVLAGVLST